MLQREQLIKHIASQLSQFQSELKLNNAASLFDANHTAEDFICGLLNLVYGSKLENENHRQKNSPAVDLTDSQNRVAVQVTSDSSRDKIQATIDRFIDHSLYRDYDQLFIFLLSNRINYQKPFETGGYFLFSHKENISDIGALMQKISTLDTKKLKEIDSYLGAELDLSHRRRRLLAPSIIVLLLVLAVVVAFGAFSRNKPVSKVYFSELLPYTDAGYYTSYVDASPIYLTELETSKAFSILSFVRCEIPSASRIENISCHIIDLKSVEKPVLILDACIVDHTLKIFAFNNGWGIAKAPGVEAADLIWNSCQEPLSRISSDARFSKEADIPSAGASLLAEYDLDAAKFQEAQTRCSGSGQIATLSVQVQGKNCSAELSVYLRLQNGKFFLESGGVGDHSPDEITLFAILDVEEKPSVISFTGPEATPRVEDTLRVETVLAPTKSCSVKCQNRFFIDGKEQETDIYTANVAVPAFTDIFTQVSNAMTLELAELDNPDEASIRQITQKYLYDPHSVYDLYIQNRDVMT